MIRTVKLKFGSAQNQAPVHLDVAPVTLFVGPNNSGKSLVLQELNRRCRSGVPHQGDVILESVDFVEFPAEQIPGIKKGLTLRPHENETIRPGRIIVGKHHRRTQVLEAQFVAALGSPNTQSQHFCQWYLALHTLMLDGKSRITLVDEQNATDLLQAPENFLDTLFRNDRQRVEVRRITHDAFGNFFVVDPTALGKLRIRFSRIAPQDHREERGIHEEAVRFHENALNIADAGDGVKAFTGIITQIIAGDPSIILIDEPEAFLHPALSFKLGKEVAVSAASSDKRLFVSTHSANFVMGCIQSGAPTNIVNASRIPWRWGGAEGRLVDNVALLL